MLSCVLNCNELQVASFDRTMPSTRTWKDWKDELANALAEQPGLWVKTEASDSVNLPAVSRFQASDKYYQQVAVSTQVAAGPVLHDVPTAALQAAEVQSIDQLDKVAA